VDGILEQVPKDAAARKKWLAKQRGGGIAPEVRAALEKWYGADKARSIQLAEAFELCEYGRRPTDQEIRQLFPMLK